jgi:hypothetical protein
VVVTLEAASWAELEAANAKLSKEGLELPSFGTLEKEKEAAEAAEEKVGNTHGLFLGYGTYGTNDFLRYDGEVI